MNIQDFLNKHGDLIKEALEDYLRWFESGEENHDRISLALQELDELNEMIILS